jgi:hypothetical protein
MQVYGVLPHWEHLLLCEHSLLQWPDQQLHAHKYVGDGGYVAQEPGGVDECVCMNVCAQLI